MTHRLPNQPDTWKWNQIVICSIELNVFMFLDAQHSTTSWFTTLMKNTNAYRLDKKLTLFQQKQEQQQVLLDFENGVIVKIYKS